jgi:hypothetical protein
MKIDELVDLLFEKKSWKREVTKDGDVYSTSVNGVDVSVDFWNVNLKDEDGAATFAVCLETIDRLRVYASECIVEAQAVHPQRLLQKATT